MAKLIPRHQLTEWGVGSRLRRDGPEKRLVDWFLDTMPVQVPEDCALSIFEEPKLESGFPDLVLVLWDVHKTEHWEMSRDKLTQTDIIVLHALYQRKRSTAFELEKLFNGPIDDNLERLIDAAVIDRSKSNYFPLALENNFAVRRIIAVEAKISDIKGGLAQASLNTWFAHDSVLLVPQPLKDPELLGRSAELGVTVMAQQGADVLKPAACRERPLSYTSWLFNEWVWKASAVGAKG